MINPISRTIDLGAAMCFQLNLRINAIGPGDIVRLDVDECGAF